MIVETRGDLLATEANIICHQVNFEGVMGGGVALAIRNKLLTDKQYRDYVSYCTANRHDALGEVLFMPVEGYPGRYVANLFSQNAFSTRHGALTNYSALRTCLEHVAAFAAENGFTVAMPGYIGCGIAGGDWKVVRGIIGDVFKDYPGVVTLYFL